MALRQMEILTQVCSYCRQSDRAVDFIFRNANLSSLITENPKSMPGNVLLCFFMP